MGRDILMKGGQKYQLPQKVHISGKLIIVSKF